MSDIPKMDVEDWGHRPSPESLGRVVPWGSKPKEGNYEDGYIVNCEITPRAGETPFSHVGGRVRVYLDGYSIKPKEDNGWISVEDRMPARMPEKFEAVLISDGENVGHARLTGRGWSIIASNDMVPDSDVTHWQPLPEAPHNV